MDKLAALMRKLDYQFKDSSLLELALTHRSKAANNYERLEFLGDSILGFVIADWLYAKYSNLPEGRLSRMRSSLVRKETLAKVARSLSLSDFLILGEGELKSGGFNRDSILADAVESLIGAIYLDSGFDHSKEFIFDHFAPYLNAVSEHTSLKDAKSRLQEYRQKRGLPLPDYQIVDIAGKQHEQEFTVECRFEDSDVSAQATASSRRMAEQQSAQKVLDILTAEHKN